MASELLKGSSLVSCILLVRGVKLMTNSPIIADMKIRIQELGSQLETESAELKKWSYFRVSNNLYVGIS